MATKIERISFIEITADVKSEVIKTSLIELGFHEAPVIAGSIQSFTRGNANILLNTNNSGFGANYRAKNGTSVSSLGIVVSNTHDAWHEAVESGAWPVGDFANPDLPYPAIYGPGDALVYFVDEDFSEATCSKEDAPTLPHIAGLYCDNEHTRDAWLAGFEIFFGLHADQAQNLLKLDAIELFFSSKTLPEDLDGASLTLSKTSPIRGIVFEDIATLDKRRPLS